MIRPTIVFFRTSLAGLLIVAGFVSTLAAADWSRWRGPQQNGVSPETGVFRPEGFGLEVDWNQPLGVAFSGIAVAGERAVTMFGDGESDWLLASRIEDGSEIWRYRIADMFPKIGGSTGGPLSMPVIDDGFVYGLAAQGHLFAVRLDDGSEVWTYDLVEKLGARPPRFGFTTAPLIVDDLVFVAAGGDQGRALAAFDKKTGKKRWNVGDDTVGYQCPTLAELAGRRQIVAMANRAVYGLEPRSGKVLWSAEHGTGPEDGSGTPILLGDDRVLISGRSDSVAYRIEKTGDGFEARELWRANVFKRSYATPVLHEGHLYGFNGNFLTCIDASSGDKVWTSRPPGGRGLILVDGHLIIYANDGSVVAVEATPDGYVEKARVQVSDNGSYTYPSFADNAIYVRNSDVMARVSISAMVPVDRATIAAPPANEFERFVRRVEASSVKRLLVDDFMSAQKQFPIIEDHWVHFVYRGDVEDVAIKGTMAEYEVEVPLERIEGTDLFHRTFEIEPGARLEYRLNVDFENVQPDPLNPRRVPGAEGDFSEVVMPGYALPSHVQPYRGDRPGRTESLTHESKALGNERQVHVYLPTGYDSGRERYPVALFLDGKGWLDRGYVTNSLDHLTGSDVAPLIAVFVEQPPGSQDELGDRFEDYLRMLADELVPLLDRTYRTRPTAAARAVIGTGRAGAMAALATVERPESFGHAASYSVYLNGPLSDRLLQAVAAGGGTDPGRLLVVWNRYDLRRADWDFDIRRDSSQLHEALRGAGFRVEGGEVLDSWGWGGWRAQVVSGLGRLFPG